MDLKRLGGKKAWTLESGQGSEVIGLQKETVRNQYEVENASKGLCAARLNMLWHDPLICLTFCVRLCPGTFFPAHTGLDHRNDLHIRRSGYKAH
jgi:hypothetical protein